MSDAAVPPADVDDDLERTTRCTGSIPKDPHTPELIARRDRLEAQWESEMEVLRAAGWRLFRANTMEHPTAGTYRRLNLFVRPKTEQAR
ncbi:hypothetical protein [Plantibacter sp. RU18]|uniref:hypothetical protein n=1 Tax=Plantibacter sp. RU18 TaxID=3158143 RepID=UPI003D36A636